MNRRIRQGERLVICPHCGDSCRAGSSAPSFTYYYCKSGCRGGVKISRPVFTGVVNPPAQEVRAVG